MPSGTTAELALVQAEGKLKVDPNITVEMMQEVVEGHLMAEGSRHFLDIIDMVTAAATTWSSRPKVSLFRSKRL